MDYIYHNNLLVIHSNDITTLLVDLEDKVGLNLGLRNATFTLKEIVKSNNYMVVLQVDNFKE